MSFQTAVYGKYFLLDRIAVGGMAEVFKAKTFGVRGFERLLVIKRILPHLSKDEEFVEMFIDEAKTSVELSHANICQVSDLGKIGDNYFIAMEYIDGKDLRAILKKGFSADRPLTIDMAISVTIEILKGLDYAHRKKDSITGKPLNVIHRDISPQNVMVSYTGEVKIVDFGIAKTESRLSRTQAGVLKGKFGYMSPEQAAGLELDFRTDLFSTGIILYEMLTGRRLFLGGNDFETLELIKECKVPSPTKYNPEISPELERLVLKAVAKEKEDRFGDAQEFQVALSRILYTGFPDFAPKQLADFLQDLFAPEIQQEQESLRRAIDALPPDELAAATSAAESAHDRIVESGSRRGSISSGSAVRSRTIRPVGLTSSGSRSRSRPSKARTSNLSTVLLFLAAVGAGAYLGWKWLYPSATPKPVPVVTPKPPTKTETMEVKISSEPSGASLKIDGEAQPVTPTTVKLYPGRNYKFELSKKGYKTIEDVRPITKDQSVYQFALEKEVPKEGLLRVSTDPPGAKIRIDEKDTGLITPAEIEGLKLNVSRVIRLDLPGYKPIVQSFVLKEAEKELSFSMKENTVELRIHVVPENARILIDGKEHGVNPRLETGKTYKLRVEAKGYLPKTMDIRPSSKLEMIDIKLNKEEYGTISLNGKPWATILLDGNVISNGDPVIDHQLSVGKHTFTFRHPDFRDVEKVVNIRAGSNDPIIVDFKNP